MSTVKTLEVPVKAMDCAECTQHVQHAIAALPGVESVNVFLASEKAIVRLDPGLVEMPAIRQAVESAGYTVKDEGRSAMRNAEQSGHPPSATPQGRFAVR